MRHHTLLAIAGLLLGTGIAHAQDAAKGKALFTRDGCYECHGYVGQGGPGLRLAPSPLTAKQIATYIRNPAGEMPPYTSAVISDSEIADIQAYLASIKPPPALKDIPELN